MSTFRVTLTRSRTSGTTGPSHSRCRSGPVWIGRTLTDATSSKWMIICAPFHVWIHSHPNAIPLSLLLARTVYLQIKADFAQIFSTCSSAIRIVWASKLFREIPNSSVSIFMGEQRTKKEMHTEMFNCASVPFHSSDRNFNTTPTTEKAYPLEGESCVHRAELIKYCINLRDFD